MKFSCLFLILLTIKLGSQSLYDPDQLQEIKIYFPYANWDQKLDSLRAADSDARLLATSVILNGISFDSVGIRYKGNSSYNPSRPKNPFNIKLDYIVSDQKYEGYNTLKLSSGFMDPSFLREVLGYQIARQYLPAPKANFINVYVNDVLLGLYTNVEDVDNVFLSNHFYSTDGAFFQCDRTDKQVQLPTSCPPGMTGSALKFVTTDSACYYNSYEQESSAGWKEFISMMQVLGQTPSNIESTLDVDRALWMLALNNFYVNLDSYSGSGHNYLMYQNDLGRFYTIPWDFNEFYGAFTNAGTGASLNLMQMQQLDPLLHLTNPERPLISKLFSIPKYKRRYLAHLNTILEEAKSSNGYESDGMKYQNLISSSVTNDKNKFFNDAAFRSNLYSDYTAGTGMAKTYPGLISLTNARINFLNSHVALNVVKPIISEISHSPTVLALNSTVSISARILNRTAASLFYRFDKAEKFIELPMYDDGLHADGAAGDGIYAASAAIGNHLNFQYYLYAENEFIASVSPVRAEYEFYNLKVDVKSIQSGALRLNELMPSNTDFVADESGDYEDWFELYNTTDSEIKCLGLYVSDNTANKLKWAFPDTTIPPKSYLIVWADEDGKDPGLHANFKLSKSGESLMIYNSDSSLVDSIRFPEIQDNHSFAFCPTNWITTSLPSFNKENSCIVSNNNLNQKSYTIYPNPFNESMVIKIPDDQIGTFQLINSLGQIVVNFNKALQVNGEYKISTQSIPPGIYNLNIRIGNQKFVEKIIKL